MSNFTRYPMDCAFSNGTVKLTPVPAVVFLDLNPVDANTIESRNALFDKYKQNTLSLGTDSATMIFDEPEAKAIFESDEDFKVSCTLRS